MQIEIKADVGYDPNTVEALTPAEFSHFISPELTDFEAAFAALGQNPLTGVERSILRTYLAWKCGKLK